MIVSILTLYTRKEKQQQVSKLLVQLLLFTFLFLSINLVVMGQKEKTTTKQQPTTNNPKAINNQLNTLKGINTPADESNVYYDATNQILYFVRRFYAGNTGGKNDGGDIWYTEKKDDGTWGTPLNLGSPVNTPDEDLLYGVSNAGTTLWLYGKYDDQSLLHKKSYLFKYKKGTDFFERQRIKYFHNSSKTPTFFVNETEDILLLSINTFDTKGVEDLYISFANPKGNKYHWTFPQNLGSVINTKFQEVTPYLSEDKITLFFSSNGHGGGMGNKDVFLSQRTGSDWTHWSTPYHLNSKTNTKGIDFYFTLPVKGTGYFSSTFDSYGYGDIKMTDWNQKSPTPTPTPPIATNQKAVPQQEAKPASVLPLNTKTNEKTTDKETITVLMGEVFDKQTNHTIQAKITLTNVSSQQKYGEIESTTTGLYTFKLPSTQLQLPLTLDVKVEATNFLTLRETIEISKTPYKHFFKLSKLSKGSTIPLDNVLFKSGTSILLNKSIPQLESIKDAMVQNPSMSIELMGHTDGADRVSNKVLSQKRVDIVKKYLINQGIEKSRVTGIGYGSSIPLYNNEDKENREKNRRVEFKIINF